MGVDKLMQKRNAKKLNKRQKIELAITCAIYLLLAFMDILLLDLLNMPIWVYELLFGIQTILFVFLLIIFLLDYQFKYLFLGKGYTKQIMHLEYLRKFEKYYCLYLTPRKARHNYRIYGDILMPLNTINRLTPFDLITSECYGVDVADDKQWQNSLLVQLFLCVSDGRGLYGYFEGLACYSDVPFADLKREIVAISDIPQKLKSLLIGTRAKKVYEYNLEYVGLTDKQHEELERLEKTYSPLANNYEKDLMEAVGKRALEKYKNYHRAYSTIANVVKIFINKTNDIRYIIWMDKKTKAYRLQCEEFLPLYEDVPILNNTYSWFAKENYGLYGSIQLAENEIKKDILNFDEIIVG